MLKLGIMGMSEGNAHPYSWASIINGVFNTNEIAKVGYPAVAAYLQANSDTLGINAARVTHVWAQEAFIAKSIAASSGIENICDRYEEMIGSIDAVLLTRDDPENHVKMAKPFIDAGVPVFIDKPLASNTNDLNYFKEEAAKGKFIMSCSSMRYANEARIVKQDLSNIGELQLITAVGKKDWIKYGVHMLEGVFALVDDLKAVSVVNMGEADKDIVKITFVNGLIATIYLYMDIAPTFQISVFGKTGWRLIDIKNSYSQFRDNIIEFIRSIQEGKPRLSFEKTENIIKVLIAAAESRKNGGVKIDLN